MALGGNGAVDAAFRDPPRVDAQVVDPREYPTRWRATRVAAPHLSAGAKQLDAPAPFGQVALLQVVGSATGYLTAWADVQGWSGDSWVPYRQDGATCVAVDVAMADSTGADRLAGGLRTWAARMPRATVTTDGSRLRLRSCDPGAAHTLVAPDPDPFDVLADRASLIHELMDQSGWGFKGARCVSDGILTQVGPRAFVEGDGNDPATAQLAQRVFTTAAARC